MRFCRTSGAAELQKGLERRAAENVGLAQLAAVKTERGNDEVSVAAKHEEASVAGEQLELPQSRKPTPPEVPDRPVLYRLGWVPEEYRVMLRQFSAWGFSHVAFVEKATVLGSPVGCHVKPDKKQYFDGWVEKRHAVAFT